MQNVSRNTLEKNCILRFHYCSIFMILMFSQFVIKIPIIGLKE